MNLNRGQRLVKRVFPNNKIVAIPYNGRISYSCRREYLSLRGESTREWFSKHANYCLPLLIGNQYGFVVKSQHSVEIEWNGGRSPTDTIVNYIAKTEDSAQQISSHFGDGIVTIQNSFVLRTPPSVNLMTINPPNSFIDGLAHMTGVIECDNLRRDFTFNLKLTRPKHRIIIKKGDWIGCIIPFPRYFVDSFDMIDATECMTPAEVAEEQQCGEDFRIEREGSDKLKPTANGRRYFRGVDIYGNKFPDHQNRISAKEKNTGKMPRGAAVADGPAYKTEDITNVSWKTSMKWNSSWYDSDDDEPTEK